MSAQTNTRSGRRKSSGGLNRPVAGWISALLLIAIALGVAWLYRSVRLGVTPSRSMVPTLREGDWYLIRIDAYRHAMPERGDVVVTRDPEKGKDHELLVKRVVAVAGDRVQIAEGRVWLNGGWLREDYIKQQPGIREVPVAGLVPDGQVLLLGDNRNDSKDSRDFGPVPVKDIMGRVTAVLLPWKHRRPIDAPPPPDDAK